MKFYLMFEELTPICTVLETMIDTGRLQLRRLSRFDGSVTPITLSSYASSVQCTIVLREVVTKETCAQKHNAYDSHS